MNAGLQPVKLPNGCEQFKENDRFIVLGTGLIRSHFSWEYPIMRHAFMEKMSDEECNEFSKYEADVKSIICTNTPREEQQKTVIGGDSGKNRIIFVFQTFLFSFK